MSFLNKVVIITGASSGIGAAAAKLFAREGAQVAIVGRNQDKLRNVEAGCAKLGKTPLVIQADVSKDEDAKKIVQATIEKYNKLDVLVNNAGIARYAGLADEQLMEIYDEVMNTNLRAAVQLTSLSAEHLKKTKGNVVNISSILGTVLGSYRYQAYCISKAGLNQFSRSAALDLARHGVRVNAISPGPVETDIMENSGLNNYTWDTEKGKTALKRVSKSEEVADLIAYLASDKAVGITGANYLIDNGYLINH